MELQAPFPNLVSLRNKHNELVNSINEKGFSGENEGQIKQFMELASKSGRLLDQTNDREAVQGILDYWKATFYTNYTRTRQKEPFSPFTSLPFTVLARFDSKLIEKVVFDVENWIQSQKKNDSTFENYVTEVLLQLVRIPDRGGRYELISIPRSKLIELVSKPSSRLRYSWVIKFKRYISSIFNRIDIAETVHKIITVLQESQVLFIDQEDCVHLNYESLIRMWPRLRDSLEKRLRKRNAIQDAAFLWEQRGEIDSGIIKGDAGEVYKYDDLSNVEIAFLDSVNRKRTRRNVIGSSILIAAFLVSIKLFYANVETEKLYADSEKHLKLIIKDTEDDNAKMRIRMAKSQKEQDNLVADLSQKSQEIAALKKEHALLRSTSNNLKSLNSHYAMQLQSLSTNLLAIQNTFKEQEQKLKNTTLQNEELSNYISILTKKDERLNQRIAELEEKLKEPQKEKIERLLSDIAMLEANKFLGKSFVTSSPRAVQNPISSYSDFEKSKNKYLMLWQSLLRGEMAERKLKERMFVWGQTLEDGRDQLSKIRELIRYNPEDFFIFGTLVQQEENLSSVFHELEKMVSDVVPMLLHENEQIRSAAKLVISRMGSRAVDALLSAISSSSNNLRLRIESVHALQNIGLNATAAQELIKLLNDDSQPGSLRIAIVNALGRANADTKSAVPTLLRIASDVKLNEELRTASVHALQNIGLNAIAAQELIKLLNDDSQPGSLRIAIVNTLGSVKADAKSAVPTLLRIASDVKLNEELRTASVHALQNIGLNATAVQELIKLLNDDSQPGSLRIAIVNALGSVKANAESVVDCLVNELDRAGDELRNKIEQSLLELGRTSFSGLKNAISSPKIKTRISAIKLLGDIGREYKLQWIPELLPMLNDEENEVRDAVRSELSKANQEEAQVIVNTLGSPIERIQDGVMRVLVALDSKAVPALARALNGTNADVQKKAALTLNRIDNGSSDAINDLLKAHKSDNPLIIAAAESSLSKTKSLDESKLIELLKDPEEDHRFDAARILIQAHEAAPESAWKYISNIISNKKAEKNLREDAINLTERYFDYKSGGRMALDAIIHLVKEKDTDPKLRVAGIQSLIFIGRKDRYNDDISTLISEALIQVAQNDEEDPNIRVLAVQAIGRIQRANETVIDGLTKIVRDNPVDSSLTKMAREVLLYTVQ
tara:strand:- start:54666 stop:58196 length:3531 start_codon:yes stop_codon:yes gene_type:complete